VGGIALTGVTGTGTWAYSLDGSTFTSVGTVSTTSALLLPKTASLRFTPTGTGSQTATISYRAWDTTTGTAGNKADATTSGGSTAFSSATDTASLSVNTAPVLTAASPSLGSTSSAAAKTIALSGTFLNNSTGTTTITDADTGAVVGGIALTGVAGSGTWAYSLDGSTFTSVGTVSTTSALLLPKTASLRYTPGGSSQTATITYRAWDTTTGTAGNKADTTTSGGSTAFSSATDTASLSLDTAALSGFVYVDTNNDGLRTKSGGKFHVGIPGVPVKLLSKGTGSTWTEVPGKSPILTGSDGSYRFEGLPAGTYRIQEVPPAKFKDGKDTAGQVGGTSRGTAGDDQIEVQLAAGEQGSEYDFGEHGLRAQAVSLRMFLASSRPSSKAAAGINAAPTVDLSKAAKGSGSSVSYTAGGSVAIAATDAALADADSPMLSQMTVTITNLTDGESEKLTADTSGTSLTSAYSGGVLTISGVAGVSTYQQVLKTVKYSNTATSPHAANRTVKVAAFDGCDWSKNAVATVLWNTTP